MAQNNGTILLHSCCAICSAYPINLLKELEYHVVVYFCNHNLDTQEEFNKRLNAERKVCTFNNVDLIIEKYNHNKFLTCVQGLENEPERGKRCEKCIKLRLESTAQKARELGINKFTTSLVISPHKNFLKISEIGHSISQDLEYVAIDFKKKDVFLKTNNISKQLELYRQNYCGCEFSRR